MAVACFLVIFAAVAIVLLEMARIASDNNVDVTICDVNLPDGNGLEFVGRNRRIYPLVTYLHKIIVVRGLSRFFRWDGLRIFLLISRWIK